MCEKVRKCVDYAQLGQGVPYCYVVFLFSGAEMIMLAEIAYYFMALLILQRMMAKTWGKRV